MSMLVAALVFVPLLAIALACLIWSAGGTWPIRSHELLAKAVVGRPGVARVPRLATFAVGVAAAAAGIAALALADHAGGGPWLTTLGALLALGFLARGLLGFTQGWRTRYPEQPFAALDRRNYSPLALLLGAGFAILVLMRLL